MQRAALILAYFFIAIAIGSANCFSQQYPFVQYTPKDGLISNMIKNIYQDSKGRLYFTSLHGLSVYDGSRFINYNSKNGLYYELVNCVMEMGADSIWIITNSAKLNCLVRGKMKLLPIHGDGYIINNLCRDSRGDIYAVAEEGLLVFNKKDRFIKLPFVDSKGEDLSAYTSVIFSVGDNLLVQRDNSMLPKQNQSLYLYSKTAKRITAEMPGVYGVQTAKDGRIWISTETKIMALDTTEVAKGKLVAQELPEQYAQLRNKGRYFLIFDDGNNCWLGNQNNILIKTAPDGKITTFTPASGLNMFFINSVFQDREGITWIATNNTGVSKLVHTNFSHIENPFGIVHPSDISYNRTKNNLLIYSIPSNTVAIIHNNEKKYLYIKGQTTFTRLIETPYGFFGIDRNTIYKLDQNKDGLYPKAILSDSSDNIYPDLAVDKAGNLIVSGKYHLSAVINGKLIYKTKLPFFADLPAIDNNGNIWVATRANDLVMYQTHPEDLSHYLEQKLHFKKELSGISPRSVTIDQFNNIWIGTRNHGIHIFHLDNGDLIKKFVIAVSSGLSDEFTTHLICDSSNAIWASSVMGLDKIILKNNNPIIENITRQNNIYQSVFTIVSDKENNVWGLVSNGVIRIAPERKEESGYTPTLMISMLKAGTDTIINGGPLSYKQNYLTFNFSATSFLNEKQVMYSYRLQGGTNHQWSEPSNNSTVSFIDLPPGDYSLDVRANFPADRYAGQNITYKFSILPPWWQTWWFRSVAGLLIIGLLIIGVRFYYRRKLEKEKAALERQQVIERERTRIATDMHDDLGAGLSRIKFLSQSILNKESENETIKTELEKITSFSDEMSEKMGEIVWALNEKNDTLADLIAYTRSYAVEYLANHNIQCEANTPMHLPGTFITGEMRRNIFLSVKECLHNIVKHAGANKVCFSVQLDGKMQIVVHDNGKGIDLENRRAFSNGIENIRKRMREINGEVNFSNEQGTKVVLTIPFIL